MKYNAFSLIELMVVVAIVAILSVISVPMYKNYVITSRAASVVPIIEGLMDDAKDYANSYGYFPTAGQLSMANTAANQTVSNPSKLSQYLSQLKMGDTSTSFGAANPCGRLGYIWGLFDPTTLGLASGGIAMFTCLMGNANSYVKTTCYYGYAPSAGFTSAATVAGGMFLQNAPTGNFIPGWNNETGGFATEVAAFIADTSCM